MASDPGMTWMVLLNADATENATACAVVTRNGRVVSRCQAHVAHELLLTGADGSDMVRLCCEHADEVERWRECVTSVPIAECVT